MGSDCYMKEQKNIENLLSKYDQSYLPFFHKIRGKNTRNQNLDFIS